MTESNNPQAAAEAVRRAIREAGAGLIERQALVEGVALAAVAHEHVLVIGPPGTAKSEAVRRIAATLGGSYFEYLIGRFTEPNEIFGPVDLRRLREGVVETQTTGMLPEAEVAFLDEIFLGSTAILNTLLGILNERIFRRGHTTLACPLRLCVGASNTLPTDEALAAFADRFLIRMYLDPLPDPRLEELLEGGWALDQRSLSPVCSVEHLDVLGAAARGADLAPVRSQLAHAIRLLRGAGVQLTDRRAVRIQRLIAAAAVLAGRPCPTEADLWPIVLAVPTRAEQGVARDTLRDLLERSENPALPTVTEQASLGPLARAARLVATGRALLEQYAAGADGSGRAELEAVAREIDAGFTRETLPAELAEVRAQIVALLEKRG